MWGGGKKLMPTVVHHIAREYAPGKFTRELKMFYTANPELRGGAQTRDVAKSGGQDHA
jgi:hypothetical protein